MAWSTAPDGQNHLYRLACTIDTTGATPGGAAVIALVSVGPEFEQFWSTVQSSGYDVTFGKANGDTITHERATWTYASKVAQFRISVTLPASAPSGSVYFVYLYWGVASAIAADPSAGPFVSTVSGAPQPARLYADGRHIAWASPSWAQDSSSSTPTPAQTAVVGVGESRHIYADLGFSLRYQTGFSYRGQVNRSDVEWAFVETSGSVLSAATWMLPGNLKLSVTDSGALIRCMVTVDDPSDALAVLTVGWDAFGEIEKHYLTIRGIEPAI